MTRQWLANPSLMCSKHINGEHAEAHGFMSRMHQGHSLEGFIVADMFFGAEYVKFRHDLLAQFLPNHSTDLELDTQVLRDYPLIVPEMDALKNSLSVLISRCSDCQNKHLYH